MSRRTRVVLLLLGLLAVAVAAAAAEPTIREVFARARRALEIEADSPSIPTTPAPAINSPAPSRPAAPSKALLALPAAPSGHDDPPQAPTAPPTNQGRALPSARPAAPTCTFVTDADDDDSSSEDEEEEEEESDVFSIAMDNFCEALAVGRLREPRTVFSTTLKHLALYLLILQQAM